MEWQILVILALIIASTGFIAFDIRQNRARKPQPVRIAANKPSRRMAPNRPGDTLP